MLIKRLQLALIHTAVAMTLVPINSTLNRVMIKELALSATLVAILASLPYFFAPLQVLIGAYSDRHPILGWRRTPYIALGLGLCAAGVALAPQAVFLISRQPLPGLALSLLVFMAWGMGYNLASVAYLSLAAELSGEGGRSRTIGVMWFLMIVGIIFTAATLSRLLREYSPAALQSAFEIIALAALGLGVLGLTRLEPRRSPALPLAPSAMDDSRTDWRILLRGVLGNTQARRFFFYLVILLAAILGQDVLLEPFAGEALGLSVEQTTRITSIWGGCVLLAFLLANLLESRLSKKGVARIGALTAMAGLLAIVGGGWLDQRGVFYGGVVLLGLGTGLSTISNLSLMLDMTTAQVGLFIGAWGVANALSRLIGTLTAGVFRDLLALATGNSVMGYILVFLTQVAFLGVSLVMLQRIDIRRFREQAQPDLVERAVLMNDAT